MRYRRPKDYEQKLKDLTDKGILCAEFEPNDRDLYVEIGMGRGDFLTEYAQRFGENFYLGIEKQAPLLILAGQKVEEKNLSNVRLMSFDAGKIDEMLPAGSVSKIFLNFSDPWSKQRYSKRRLTHLQMLQKYANISKQQASLAIKTDNLDFFEFSISQIKQSDYKIVREIRDIYSEENQRILSADEPIYIQTEYEKKFISLKKAIFSLECIRI
ncbi:MAG: tRNA (guanosine(46)-N7)-methyltransferase TrmB [Peptostreptococcaceae bacterium]|nr:tRNA (guanosine(46)-N7)-methyltransferase TrmB [Peptostreptococcaceae bacterium]